MILEITNREKELIQMSLTFLFFDKGKTRTSIIEALDSDKTVLSDMEKNTLNFLKNDIDSKMKELMNLIDKIEYY